MFVMIKDVVKAINSGKIIAFPTETVYGLGCDGTCYAAVKKIYQLKNRENKPLAIMVRDVKMAMEYAQFSPLEMEIANKYWPGELTMILTKKPSKLASNVTNSNFIGIRIPNHPFMLELLKNLDVPLVATSVNISGEPPMDYPQIVENFAGKIDLIVPDDNPQNKSGESSTVVKIENGKVITLRQGKIHITV